MPSPDAVIVNVYVPCLTLFAVVMYSDMVVVPGPISRVLPEAENVAVTPDGRPCKPRVIRSINPGVIVRFTGKVAVLPLLRAMVDGNAMSKSATVTTRGVWRSIEVALGGENDAVKLNVNVPFAA
jgi:hypothetical protein